MRRAQTGAGTEHIMDMDEIALLNTAVLHADWGTQMKREPLRKCYEILEKYDKEAREDKDGH